MIRAAGLDWEVELLPARGAREINRKGEFSRYEVVRVPRPNTTENEVLLGVVGRRYQPLQNVEAFEFFDPIVGEDKAYFETAGALGEGERIWVMAKMPQAMEIVRGDECFKYLLLSNLTFWRRVGDRKVHYGARRPPGHADAGNERRTKSLLRAAQQTDAIQVGRTRGGSWRSRKRSS